MRGACRASRKVLVTIGGNTAGPRRIDGCARACAGAPPGSYERVAELKLASMRMNNTAMPEPGLTKRNAVMASVEQEGERTHAAQDSRTH